MYGVGDHWCERNDVKIRNRVKTGEAFYRSARSTLGKRIHKKLTGI